MSTIASQVESLQSEFESRPEGLRRHVERVLIEALNLAARYDVDPGRAALATWGHDLFRAFPPAELLRLAGECGLVLEAQDRIEPVLLHGPIAAVVLRDRFDIEDEEALAAVRDHTLGLAAMPILSKIILIADKVEQRKRNRTPVMKEIRRLAWRDLDLALLCWADWKWLDERQHGWRSDPRHWQARARWVAEHHLDIYRAAPRPLPGRDTGTAAAPAAATTSA